MSRHRKLIEFLRQRYRKLRGFPLSFCLNHPGVFTKGVLTGPFAGTRLSPTASWNYAPNLFLGTYEMELHPVWKRLLPLLNAPNDQIWIIGAAEGYYVCGLARLCPGLQLRAYEADPASRRLLLDNAKRNGVEDRVDIRGSCDPGELHRQLILRPPKVIISDIEGGEHAMFSNEVLSLLANSALVVEVHPPYSMLSRVAALEETHHVQVIDSKPRVDSDYPLSSHASQSQRLAWMNEHRPFDTPWIVAFPKQTSGRA